MNAPAPQTSARPVPGRFARAIVVGASSGIGAAIARKLAAGGTAVALVARREPELESVAAAIRAAGGRAIVARHDVKDFADAAPVFERLVAELGGLDMLVYASGILAVPEEGVYDLAQDRAIMEVNALGAMAWTGLAAARFEAQRGGTLVGLSSIAGERGRRTMPAYTTSKAALTAWLEALRNRVSRYGVNVVTVKPGFVDTDQTKHLAKKPMVIGPERAADLILAAARRGGSPSVFIPGRWALVAFIVRNIPSFLFRKLDL
jgi:decaprenylphospho-beta-D-erythro-pentofuranosid-2-ulose 2-reductase